MPTQHAPVEGAPRSVSVVADASRSVALREAIDAEASLHLAAVAPRFAALVVAAGFTGDVILMTGQVSSSRIVVVAVVFAPGS